MALVLDIVFALSEGVPELDRPVAGARDDLPVVGAEADGEDIGGVADEAAGSETGVQVPETEGVVPRRRKGELADGGNNNIRHEVVVAVEDALRVPVRDLVACQLPDDDSLVWWYFEMIRVQVQNTQMKLTVPREAVKIMSGFSEDVAMAVTHPL